MRPPSLLLILLVLLVGSYWIYDGLKRGCYYHPLLDSPPEQMNVVQVRNAGGRVILPAYEAVGKVEGYDALVVVDIFQDQYRKIRRDLGQADPRDVSILKVHHLNINGVSTWIADSKVEESRPIFTVLGFSFSWHFPSGILLTAAALTWFRSNRKRRLHNQRAGEALAESRRARWRKREVWFKKSKDWFRRKRSKCQ